jgi:hypothetical protein
VDLQRQMIIFKSVTIYQACLMPLAMVMLMVMLGFYRKRDDFATSRFTMAWLAQKQGWMTSE